jgi:hypothetical protein
MTFELGFKSETLLPSYLARVGHRTLLDKENSVITIKWKAEELDVLWGENPNRKASFPYWPIWVTLNSSWARFILAVVLGLVLWVAIVTVALIATYFHSLISR